MTKKQRFEIFKRDDFMCQYCGRKPPQVMLEIDHIVPKSKGGDNEIINLVTSCFDCNRGKTNIRLKTKCREDIKKITSKMRLQNEQLKEYYKFQKEKTDFLNRDLESINKYWSALHNNEFCLNVSAIQSIKIFLKYLTKDDIIEAIDITGKRWTCNPDGAFKYMCGILHNWRKDGKRQ